MIENTQSVVLNRGDMHWLSQRDCLSNEKLWKIYWWGGHRDEALIRKIERFPQLIQLPESIPGAKLESGRGFEVTKTGKPSGWLQNYKELPAKLLVRYGQQSSKDLCAVPRRVYRKGFEAIYSGRRLLVGRGIKENGFITARHETKKYCFKNSVHGIRFDGFDKWQESVITAIFWSSLARYYYFATAGSWGFWHFEIHLENVEAMPICFPKDGKLRDRIVRIVEELQSLELHPELELAGIEPQRRLPKLERQLDEAVFDLYELNVAERDLVREMCDVGLDLFYRHQKSSAAQPVIQPTHNTGTLTDLSEADEGLAAYLRTFLESWNDELEPDGEFSWQILSPPSNAPLLAVRFTTRYKKDPLPKLANKPAKAWHDLLAKLEKESRVHAGSPQVFTDTFFRFVSDREIFFIKRNERRFWTRTAAREDAESALTHLINLEEGQK